jgi:hypothetical protein
MEKERAVFIYTNKALLEHLKTVAKQLGRPPLRKEIEHCGRDGVPSIGPYYVRFGSFTEALKLAGLKPRRITKSETI